MPTPISTKIEETEEKLALEVKREKVLRGLKKEVVGQSLKDEPKAKKNKIELLVVFCQEGDVQKGKGGSKPGSGEETVRIGGGNPVRSLFSRLPGLPHERRFEGNRVADSAGKEKP